jgi:hypothetical protein
MISHFGGRPRPLRQPGLVLFMAVVIVLFPHSLLADGGGNEEGTDHTIIVGVGGAGELELADGSLHPGANLMVEWRVSGRSGCERARGVARSCPERGPF